MMPLQKNSLTIWLVTVNDAICIVRSIAGFPLQNCTFTTSEEQPASSVTGIKGYFSRLACADLDCPSQAADVLSP